MAASPAKFYCGFLIVSIILWMIFIICSRLFLWMLGAFVKFRVSGLKCLRDVVVKFEKGAIESVSVGEIKLSLRQFLITIKDPKMKVLICDLEVVMRSSSTSTTNLHNYESQKTHTLSKGKWIMVANIARFLSVSVTDLVVKTPKVIVEVKELKLDISKDGGTKPNLSVKLNVLPILVHLCESRISLDQSSDLGFERCSSSASPDIISSSAALFCDELSLFTEFGHEREVGIIIQNVEVISGDVIMNFDEDSFPENKQSLASIQGEVGTSSTTTTSSENKPYKEHQLLAALTKYSPTFPEKVLFRLRSLDVVYRENGLVAENNITGIILTVKSKSFEDTGESTRLDIEIVLSETHLLRKDESSIVKITKVDLVSFVDIPIQPDLPIRAEVDIKVGTTRCDLITSRLQPWLLLYGGTHGKTHTRENSKAADMETIMWRGTVSAPEMTVILYGLDDLPMFHFCLQPSLVSANNISSMGTTIHVEVGELYLQLADEPHTRSILSYASEECKRLKYSVSLEISQFSFCLNKALHSIQLELVRVKSIYKEYMEEHKPCSKVTLFDMHNVKFESRSSCSLFSATDISLSWEPDVHLSFHQLFLRLRALVYAQKLKEDDSDCNKDISSVKDVDEQKKKESIFAIDVEMLTISAKVDDKVEIQLEVKSIFSEKVSVGVLLEEIILAFNGSRVFKSTRMQISRILGMTSSHWGLVVQGSDVHICLPYKLQLRAIADSIDEMLQGLKLITTEKEENIFPGKAESSKPKEYSPNFGCIRFCMRRVTAYIEEEPMQGWLDEHYQLMKKEACEVAVRLNFLHKETSDYLAIKEAMEEIHQRSFQSYYKACKDLIPSEGSGACREGFQAGFMPSSARTSLLSVCATEFDLSLTAVHEDDAGLMEVLKNLDPICQENDITFSRLNGSNVCLKTGSLTVKLRNYTLPLLSCTSGKCEGRIVQLRDQQGDEENCKSSGQPQISQDVFVGRWRKVKMFRSASGTTQPMKTYSDLRIEFEKGEVSFGVGYEPAFADISYAVSVALGTNPQVIEEEQSLPWWDNMRNNFHGNISLSFSDTKWTVLATTDPYESGDKLQIVTGGIEFKQSDGRVFVNAKDFKIKLSSLESLITRHSLEVPHGTFEAAFFEAPVFTLEVIMDWYCESENALNVFDPFRSTSLSLQWNFSFRPENESIASASPTMNLGGHDLAWILKFCGMNSDPPNKLRSFSRWPRFGVPRLAIQESLSLDQVMTEFMLRVDVTPYLIKYMPWDIDDPAKGLTFSMKKLKYELCFSRGKQKYTFECNRDALDLVYQSLDLRVVKAFIDKDKHHRDEGFLLSSEYLTIRRQAPKADLERLFAWQEAGRRNLENGSESDEHIGSDSSDDDDDDDDDDEYNVVIADNCQRVFVYGLKLLWTIQNRDVVRSFAGGISKAFQPPKPSPYRQYTQMKILEENQKESCPETHQDRVGKVETSESKEEGTQHFVVNIIKPQFNLHSEEANGRFLLAAVSGRALARSFHSIMRVDVEVIEQALGTGSFQIPECSPEMTWKRREFSIMLEHVQAHVAPTDTDPGAGLQWLPKIRRNHTNVKRTGALLESVFMPCDMYLRYTRHKAGTLDLKVKPLKEITFNSQNITATMTSRQFQIMMDVLANLLFARLPKPRKSSLQCPTDDEDVEEEADEVVPYGVEEVELAKINLEKKERERKLLLDDIRKLSPFSDNMDDTHMEMEGELWMISTRRSILVQGLKNELLYAQKSRKEASASLRMELQKAAQLRLLEKEKNKSPSYAMSISLHINKVVWSMLKDGKSFAEAEINDMIYDFDRDYKDIGVAQFTTKSFVVRNCLPNAKSDMILSAWNPPPEWGKKVMLRVDTKQGAPKDGNYPFELFQVEIYPLRIHLTETMYRMMWEYFFPEEEQDSQRRQEVWKISTTAGSKRVKKGLAGHESSGTTSHSIKDFEASRVSSSALPASATVQSQSNADSVQKSNLRSSTGCSAPELRRTSSFDKNWEENVAESVANELVLQAHSCTVSSSIEQQEDPSKQKLKETKPVKSGRSSHEEKKAGKSHEEKKSRPRKMMEFRNIKISQVELLVTYEGSRFVVNDLKLLMDTFHRVEFTGTWRRLFSRVKKHIIWGVLKSVTGMQGKKFKDKSHNNRESTDNDLNLSDNEQTGKPDQQQVTWFKRQSDGAGDGFVTSIRGLFNTQRRKAKAFVLRTMRGEAENDFHGDWSDSDVESSTFARQLTITKAKRLIRRHTKKFRPRSQRGSTSQQRESLPSFPLETINESDDSSGSSPYEDFEN